MPVLGNGQTYAFNSGGGGMGVQDRLTQGANALNNPVDAVGTNASVPVPEHRINYMWYLLGVFILLVVIKILSEHEKSKLNPSIMGIGVFNFVVIGIMAMLFMVVAKIIFNKYYVKGITELVVAA